MMSKTGKGTCEVRGISEGVSKDVSKDISKGALKGVCVYMRHINRLRDKVWWVTVDVRIWGLRILRCFQGEDNRYDIGGRV